jgi:hypothetical protein
VSTKVWEARTRVASACELLLRRVAGLGDLEGDEGCLSVHAASDPGGWVSCITRTAEPIGVADSSVDVVQLRDSSRFRYSLNRLSLSALPATWQHAGYALSHATALIGTISSARPAPPPVCRWSRGACGMGRRRLKWGRDPYHPRRTAPHASDVPSEGSWGGLGRAAATDQQCQRQPGQQHHRAQGTDWGRWVCALDKPCPRGIMCVGVVLCTGGRPPQAVFVRWREGCVWL